MTTALRPSNALGPVLGVIGLLLVVLMLMSQAVTQTQVNVQPRQNSKVIFTAVIADDMPLEQGMTVVAVQIVVRALGFEPRVLTPLTASQTVQFALTGNDGAQANAVFLDGSYAENLMDWMIPDSSGFDDFAKGHTLAAYLRVSGYTGPIVLTSRLPEDYLNQPGGENFGIGLKKADFWGNPLKFLEALRNILK